MPQSTPPKIRAQIILWIDDEGAIHAEAPGRNGAREKLDIEIPRSLQMELQFRANESRAREQDEALDRNKRVYDLTASFHGHDFARQHVGRKFRKDAEMRRFLHSKAGGGFSHEEIDQMEERGELKGTAFFSSAETEMRKRIREDNEALGRNPPHKTPRKAHKPQVASG